MRLALLEEAVEIAQALEEANPFRAKVLAKTLDAREEQGTQADRSHGG